MITRWKLMAGVLGVSLGGLAGFAGQCPKDGAKARRADDAPPVLPDLPKVPGGGVTPGKPTPPPVEVPPPAPAALPPLPDVGAPKLPPVPPPSPAKEEKKPEVAKKPAPLPVPLPSVPPSAVIPAGGTLPPVALPDAPALPSTPPAVPVDGAKAPAVAVPPPLGSSDLPKASAPMPPPAAPLAGGPAPELPAFAPPPSAPPAAKPVGVDLSPASPQPLPAAEPTKPAVGSFTAVAQASATVAVPSKFRIVLRVGEGEPVFEVRHNDDLVMKVISEKVDVKSPEKGGLSAVTATGKVRFVGFGSEGTCDSLSFLAGTGEVALSGGVKVQVKDKIGRVESELTADQMKYKIDTTTLPGSIKP